MNRFSRIRHHVDMKDVKKRHLQEVAAKKLEKERLKKETEQIKEKYEKLKSDWRKELKESDWTPVAGSIANSTSQTFTYAVPNLQTGEPNTFTTFGLGGVETLPSSLTIDFGFGETETINPPTYNQIALAGYAKPIVIKRKELEDINARLDASEEFAKQVNADVLMKARVAEVSPETKIYKASDFTPGEGLAQMYPPEELEKFSALNPQKFSEYKHIYDIQNEITNKFEKAQEKADQEHDAEWLPELQRLLPNNKYSNLYGKYKGSAFNEVNVEFNRLNYEEHKAMTRVKTKDGIKLRSNKKSNAIRATANKISDAIPILDELQYKLQEIWSKKTSEADKVATRESKGLQKASPKFFLPFGEMKPLELYMQPSDALELDKVNLDKHLDKVASVMGLGTAKNVFDLHVRYLKNPTGKVQEINNLISKKDINALSKTITRTGATMDQLKFDAKGSLYGSLQNTIDTTSGLKNSIGNLDQSKIYLNNSGTEVIIDKPYDFGGVFSGDFFGGDPKSALGAPFYAGLNVLQGKLSTKDFFKGTDTMVIRVRIPIKKKKKK